MRKLEGVETGGSFVGGWGSNGRLDDVYIDFGSADERQSSYYHVGFRLNNE
jgi:hypothetical protein